MDDLPPPDPPVARRWRVPVRASAVRLLCFSLLGALGVLGVRVPGACSWLEDCTFMGAEGSDCVMSK